MVIIQRYGGKQSTIQKYIEDIKKNIKFNILYSKVKSTIRYIEESYNDINYIANQIKKIFWK